MAAKSNIDNETKQKIIGIISLLVPTAIIYLFGSRARQTHDKWSDIDLAIDIGEKLPIGLLDEIKSVLAATNIPYKIEIVDVHRVSPEMKNSIEKESILWKS